MSSVLATFQTSFTTLIRREFWEHRPLWLTPLIVTACIILLTLVAAVQFSSPDVTSSIRFQRGRPLDPTMFLTGGLAAVILFHHVIASIVITFYLLDCLYAERKDRSILFWKSLPVSDTSTVLSKFVVAAVVVPTGVFLLAGITSLVAAGILYLRFGTLASHLWDLSQWTRIYGVFLVGLVSGMLWYAPVVAYLMLISAWAQRSVLLWAVLPWVMALLVEAYAFDTSYVGTFLRTRLGAPPSLAEQISAVPAMIPRVDFAAFFSSLHMWLGVVAAALLLFGAIRIRRYRDDT
jgi:ABC-2 type transport system permease protein